MNDQYSPAIFVADAPGLDFLNSVATPVDVPVDWIGDGEGLLSWLEQAGLVPAGAVATVRDRATPGELDVVAAQARQLREWFRDFVDAHRGRPLAADDLAHLKPLNRLLERDESFNQVVAREQDGHVRLELQASRHWRSPEALLQPIGTALARLVCEEDFTNVKACAGHRCTLMFADHTRRRSRRWCSMAVCGNRAKQAAHRGRLRP
ncbi:CGNR zinc finger domain-containing protein [Methylobacterium oryzisoli]|uniref:CGNR zinc finger domain-containing protein n=1 Tax=Methylobacterium oryzisoli TaxID=3385502 RepID=UPI00389285FB